PGRMRVANIRWVDDEARNQNHGKNADWNVDEEGPAPRVRLRDPSAQRWAEDRRNDHSKSERRHGQAALFRRKTFEKNRLRDRLKRAAARSLQRARDQNHRQARGRTHHERSKRENHDADDQKSLAAESQRKPAARRKDDRVRDEITREDPRGLLVRRRKAAAYVRNRYRGDGSVEHFHERRQHHRDGNEPRIDLDLPEGWRLSFAGHQDECARTSIRRELAGRARGQGNTLSWKAVLP